MKWAMRVFAALAMVILTFTASTATGRADESCDPIGSGTTNIDVTEQTGFLEIRLVNENQEPLAGADFEIKGEDSSYFSVATIGADGRAIVPDLHPGGYSIVQVSNAPGYVMATETYMVTVSANQLVSVTVQNLPEPRRRAAAKRVAAPNLAPVVASTKLTATFDPALTPVSMTISPRPEGLPEPVINGAIITWDLSALSVQSYVISVTGTSVMPGTYTVALSGEAGGAPVHDSLTVTTATPDGCGPTASPTSTTSPTATVSPTASTSPTVPTTATSTGAAQSTAGTATTSSDPSGTSSISLRTPDVKPVDAAGLANTGANTVVPIGLGVLLIGTAAALLLRRKHSQR